MPESTVKIKTEGGASKIVESSSNFRSVVPDKKSVENMSKDNPDYISTLYGVKDNSGEKKKSFNSNWKNNVKKNNQKNKKSSKRKSKWKKRVGIGVLVVVIFFVVSSVASYFFILKPAFAIRDSANRIQDNFVAVAGDFEDKDLTNLDQSFANIQTEIDFINSQIEKYSFLNSISLTKGYYQNLLVAEQILVKTQALINKTLPDLKQTLEYSGFTVASTTTNEGVLTSNPEGDAPVESIEEEQSPISLVLAEMPRYLALYEKIEPDIIDILAELENVDTRYIPNFGGSNYRESFEELKSSVKDFPETADQVTAFLSGLPDLLGSNGESRYLIILQNEAEMRSSGGLLTAYGTMTLENGELKDSITLTDTWNLQHYLGAIGISPGYVNIYGQNFLMNQGCGSTELRSQDSGIYPDLYWTAETFEDYYSLANVYDNGDFPPVEHIFIGNFKFAEDLLELVQPLEVEDFGIVTADTLFDFIKLDTDDPELSFSQERKRILDDIANAAEEKFTKLPGKDIPKLIEIFINSIKARDIAISSTNQDIQNFLDSYQLSGRSFTDFDGDYFHLNEAQNCSLKLNKFVRDSVDMTVNIAEDGSISKDIHVEWENPQVYDDSLEKLYSPGFSFWYRAWVRVFAPEGSIFTSTDGYDASLDLYYYPQEYIDDVTQKAVSDNVIRFDHRRFSEEDPIPGQELNVSYQLPENLNYNSKGVYKMLLEKHPGKSWGEPYNITINWGGEQYNIEVVLDEDKILTFRDGIITVDNVRTELDWLVGIANDIPFNELDN